ncbi:lysM domain receptor-like kinase 3 [Neltuma alba]|uniref:lysM domain receptor-like kinase 3 n=1 Tax=Neltuma alba TaxID=207710 RepID=UPI0010A49348|nr:lysM domain receptor-like kinase 3 [Prosopis alba]XP_028784149.1 lysM domain receptor-like kinase 3 [Prosopis alba]
MASFNLLPPLTHLPLLATLFVTVFSFQTSIKASYVVHFKCSAKINTCNALLYHINQGLDIEDIASLYSVNSSQIQPITRGANQDYLITVPCSCKAVTNLRGYFFDTTYTVQQDETYMNISNFYYSGQAWSPTDNLTTGENLTIHLPCGCTESDSQIIVTYTVQQNDTTAEIANLLSATLTGIQNMNGVLANRPSFIDVGWVLYVPKELNGIPSSKGSGKKRKRSIIIGVLAGVALLSAITITILIRWRKRATETSNEDAKAVSKRSTSKAFSKRSISNRTLSLKNHQFHIETIEEVTSIDSERPVTFYLEEIEEAINKEGKIIGKGGYGTVYFGILGDKEVAIKEMRSSKSKEFYAELKVLCRIHHINIVELLGYASGEDNLYLVYEYVSKGSLSDHLHDPFLKGHEPLSWTVRAQIALDAAKGLEYIHDYTKARHVHRDIKTSNILLDNKLRAKIADFGLVKLVERTNDDDFIATRLVGTPGYLPPESVKELQLTSKTDVFAFGVVLAELVTGKPALFRDSQETCRMRSLISVINKVFEANDPESALEDIIDKNLRDTYPVEDVFKMIEVAERCLREEPTERPEMREIVLILSQILMSSTEWEASLGGNSEVFSGVFTGR